MAGLLRPTNLGNDRDVDQLHSKAWNPKQVAENNPLQRHLQYNWRRDSKHEPSPKAFFFFLGQMHVLDTTLVNALGTSDNLWATTSWVPVTTKRVPRLVEGLKKSATNTSAEHRTEALVWWKRAEYLVLLADALGLSELQNCWNKLWTGHCRRRPGIQRGWCRKRKFFGRLWTGNCWWFSSEELLLVARHWRHWSENSYTCRDTTRSRHNSTSPKVFDIFLGSYPSSS